jgi:vancomycin resistance protein VanW
MQPLVLDAEPSALPTRLLTQRRRPTEVVPMLGPVAVGAYQLRRWLVWQRNRSMFCQVRATEPLPALIFAHSSPLLRKLGATEMYLQHNKITNLRLAAARIDGVLLRPGETFSFCRLVGRTTRRRGYLDGMQLDAGETVPRPGGGICQIANMIHWMALHSPLTVTQRSTHSEDPFPDEGRTVPWGTGCTIFYNYVDLQLRNDTETTYQVRVRVGPDDLEGELRAEAPLNETYRVYARDECFLHIGGRYYRRNELWRDRTDAAGVTTSELIKTNVARTLYDPTAR